MRLIYFNPSVASGLLRPIRLGESIIHLRNVWRIDFRFLLYFNIFSVCKQCNPDQMPRSVAADLDQHYVPRSTAALHGVNFVTRKPVFGVCDQGRLKPPCAATEARQRLESSDIEVIGIILSGQRTTKALIRLRGCAGWSAPLLFAYGITGFLMTSLYVLKVTSTKSARILYIYSPLWSISGTYKTYFKRNPQDVISYKLDKRS